MKGFRLICCKCGSDKVLEKSSENTLEWSGDNAVHGEIIQRKCTECDNEDFTVLKTWVQKD